MLLAEIIPPCCSTIFLQIANPRPVPLCFVVNNGSNIFSISASEIPGPESSTSTTASSFLSIILIVISPLGRYAAQRDRLRERRGHGSPDGPGRGDPEHRVRAADHRGGFPHAADGVRRRDRRVGSRG